MEDSPLDAHKKDALTDSLLHTAVVAVGILESQTHFGSVFLEVKKLFGVEGSTSLLPYELHSILVPHPTLNEGQGHQDWSSAKPCHTVHSDAAARLLSELGVEQLEPIIHDLGGRRGAIIEGPVHDLNPLLLHWSFIIGGLTHSHQCVHMKLLQLLGELVERGIGGVVGDEEPHALVGNLDCSGAVHVGETAHSGELFVIGCSRRKWKAKGFFVLVGTRRGSRAKDYAISQGGCGPLEESAVPSVLAVRGVSG